MCFMILIYCWTMMRWKRRYSEMNRREHREGQKCFDAAIIFMRCHIPTLICCSTFFYYYKHNLKIHNKWEPWADCVMCSGLGNDDRVVNHLVLNWFFEFDWIAENELLNELIFSVIYLNNRFVYVVCWSFFYRDWLHSKVKSFFQTF